MAFPEHKDVADALLYFIFLNGGSDYKVQAASTYEPLADFFNLTREERTRRRPDGYPGLHWCNRVQWARQRLINYRDLDGSERGIWRLTTQGLQRASDIAGRY
jgi:5-methylcytosine-specific restriction protein A